MASTILSDNGISSGSAGIKTTADSTGALALQTTTAGGTATTALTIDTSQNTTLAGYLNAPNTFGFKNRIINGNFGIWQRGTSGAMTTSPTYVAADRWGVDQATSAAATFSQSTSVPTAVAQYSGKVQRNNASTGTNNIVIAQAFETANSYDLAGQSATLSFYAKAGANFSGSALNYNVFYGQGTDQSLALMRANSWTGQTNSGAGTAITTTWTRYTYTVSVPAGTTQIGLQFYFSPTGTAGADDAFYITGVQLEKGSTATSFDYRPYGTELQLCQRYYQLIGDGTLIASGYLTNTLYLDAMVRFPVVMRAAPTVTKNGTWNVSGNNGQPTISLSGTSGCSLRVTATATGQVYATVSGGSGTPTLSADAEL